MPLNSRLFVWRHNFYEFNMIELEHINAIFNQTLGLNVWGLSYNVWMIHFQIQYVHNKFNINLNELKALQFLDAYSVTQKELSNIKIEAQEAFKSKSCVWTRIIYLTKIEFTIRKMWNFQFTKLSKKEKAIVGRNIFSKQFFMFSEKCILIEIL